MSEMMDLVQLDMSRNQFNELPPVVLQLPSISTVLARENAIMTVDIEQVKSMKELKELDLRGNPLTLPTWQSLSTLESIQVHIDQHANKLAIGDPHNRLDELD
jgi:Leucine-rich repeat (LRR) protein